MIQANKQSWVPIKRALHVLDDEVHGVLQGYTAVRITILKCTECSAVFRLPNAGRIKSARARRFSIHARRCPEHRRPYERSPATPSVVDSQRAALYKWEDRLLRDFHESFDWEILSRRMKAGQLTAAGIRERADAQGFALVKDTWNLLTWDECRSFVEQIWKDLYPADPFRRPAIRIDRRRSRTSVSTAEEIRLAPKMRTRVTLLHELAHAYLARVLENGSYADHGPEFAGLYVHLLARHLRLDEEDARSLGDTITPRRVVFSPPAQVAAILKLGRMGSNAG